MMKLVLHDWDDDRALQILCNCHRAMRVNTRLIVIDCVLQPGDEPDPGKFIDLNMLVMTTGGRERCEPEFRDLFAKAGFELTRIVPTATPKSVIEGGTIVEDRSDRTSDQAHTSRGDHPLLAIARMPLSNVRYLWNFSAAPYFGKPPEISATLSPERVLGEGQDISFNFVTLLASMADVSATTLLAGYGYEWSGTAYQEVAASGETGPILGAHDPVRVSVSRRPV